METLLNLNTDQINFILFHESVDKSDQMKFNLLLKLMK